MDRETNIRGEILELEDLKKGYELIEEKLWEEYEDLDEIIKISKRISDLHMRIEKLKGDLESEVRLTNFLDIKPEGFKF